MFIDGMEETNLFLDALIGYWHWKKAPGQVQNAQEHATPLYGTQNRDGVTIYSLIDKIYTTNKYDNVCQCVSVCVCTRFLAIS